MPKVQRTGKMLEKVTAKTLVVTFAELAEAYGHYLGTVAKLQQKDPDGFQAFLEGINRPLDIGQKLITELSEDELALVMKAAHRSERAQRQFMTLSVEQKLQMAKALEDIGSQIRKALGAG